MQVEDHFFSPAHSYTCGTKGTLTHTDLHTLEKIYKKLWGQDTVRTLL